MCPLDNFKRLPCDKLIFDEMICVECGRPITAVYSKFSTGNVRLNKCSHCDSTSDSYIEYEPILIVIEMFLHRPSVYRHILFNRMRYYDKFIPIQMIIISFLYILADTYAKWLLYLEIIHSPSTSHRMIDWSEILLLSGFFIHAAVEFGIYILSIVTFTRYRLKSLLEIQNEEYKTTSFCMVKYNYLVMALVISSFGKLLLIFPLIWPYQIIYSFIFLTIIFVISSNIVAVSVFLDCSTTLSLFPILFGLSAKTYFSLFLAYLLPNFVIITERESLRMLFALLRHSR